MVNPERPTINGIKTRRDQKRFWKVYRDNREAMRPFRERRRDHAEKFIGGEYGDASSYEKETLVNLLQMTAEAYQYMLASNDPYILCTSKYPELHHFARRFEVRTNQRIVEAQVGKALEQCVLDAFFTMGIIKCFRAPGVAMPFPNPALPPEPGPYDGAEAWEEYMEAQIAHEPNIWIDPGRPFAKALSFDDVVYDFRARNFEEVCFWSDTYRVPIEVVRQDDRFDRRVADLAYEEHDRYGANWDGDYEVRELQSNHHEIEDLYPSCTLMDAYFPFEGKTRVYLASHRESDPIFEEDWDGPEEGPYLTLQFGDVPDNTVGVSPSMNLVALHDLANSLFRKQGERARNSKDIVTYQGDPQDAERVRDAEDLDIVRVNHPDMLRVMRMHGPDQMLGMMLAQVDSQYNRAAGNLNQMLGLGASADTARQEDILDRQRSSREGKMKLRVNKLAGTIGRHFGQYEWHDSQSRSQGWVMVPGVDEPVELDWSPEEREGDFWQYAFDIEASSMQYKTPLQRKQELMADIQMLLPMMPMLAQTGAYFDVEALVDEMARLGELPELRRVIQIGGVMQAAEALASSLPTNSTYTRVSQSGSPSPDAQNQSAMQAFAGAGPGGGSESPGIEAM